MTDSVSVTEADWTVLDEPWAPGVMRNASATVIQAYREFIEFDDLHQEAAIFLALNAAEVRANVLASGERGAFNAVRSHLLHYGREQRHLATGAWQ